MSSLSKLVLDCHESLLVSSSFVTRLAVSCGMDVKRETTTELYYSLEERLLYLLQ